MARVKWPFGDANTLTLSATGAQALTIDNDFTIIDGVTTQATAERTLNLTIDSEVGAGAMILIKTKTNGTENTVFGTGMTGVTYAGEAGKTKNALCVYDGTKFQEVATPIKID